MATQWLHDLATLKNVFESKVISCSDILEPCSSIGFGLKLSTDFQFGIGTVLNDQFEEGCLHFITTRQRATNRMIINISWLNYFSQSMLLSIMESFSLLICPEEGITELHSAWNFLKSCLQKYLIRFWNRADVCILFSCHAESLWFYRTFFVYLWSLFLSLLFLFRLTEKVNCQFSLAIVFIKTNINLG